MCKVAGVTKITDKNRDDVWLFMQLLGEYMTRGNNDGLGYAAFDKSGKLFGEKWLINATAFADLSQVIKGLTAEKMNKIYSYFGDKVVRNEAQAIILHTRAATCSKNIENTHPFVNSLSKPEIATIHNGVIYNDEAFEKKFSTCDSEVLVHLYKDNKVTDALENLGKFVGQLRGWFTVLNLAKAKNDKMVMDIYSDNGRLESYFISELDTRIYCTSGYDILSVAKFLGLTARQKMKVKPMTSLRVDVMTGEVVDFKKLPEPVYKPGDDGDFNEYMLAGGHLRMLPGKVGQVYTANGNMNDDEFREAFFSGLTGATNWRK